MDGLLLAKLFLCESESHEGRTYNPTQIIGFRSICLYDYSISKKEHTVTAAFMRIYGRSLSRLERKTCVIQFFSICLIISVNVYLCCQTALPM